MSSAHGSIAVELHFYTPVSLATVQFTNLELPVGAWLALSAANARPVFLLQFWLDVRWEPCSVRASALTAFVSAARR